MHECEVLNTTDAFTGHIYNPAHTTSCPACSFQGEKMGSVYTAPYEQGNKTNRTTSQVLQLSGKQACRGFNSRTAKDIGDMQQTVIKFYNYSTAETTTYLSDTEEKSRFSPWTLIKCYQLANPCVS